MHTHAHRHEHTPTLTVKKSLADIKRLGDKGATFPGDTLLAAVLMQASATVWSGASFPPHCPGFSAAPSHIHNVGKKRGGGPLSSAPFTEQQLWSEARIRMIMWTVASVYQQDKFLVL